MNTRALRVGAEWRGWVPAFFGIPQKEPKGYPKVKEKERMGSTAPSS